MCGPLEAVVFRDASVSYCRNMPLLPILALLRGLVKINYICLCCRPICYHQSTKYYSEDRSPVQGAYPGSEAWKCIRDMNQDYAQ